MFGFGKKKIEQVESIGFEDRIKELYDQKPSAILRLELSSKTRAVVCVTRIGHGWMDVVKDNKEESVINTAQVIEFKDVTESDGHPHPMRESKDAEAS
jgi:hypothetical protein